MPEKGVQKYENGIANNTYVKLIHASNQIIK